MNNDEKQSRIDEAERFFNLIFDAVKECKFSYLWTKQGEERKTFPFDVSNIGERKKMAVKAIELNNNGADVYYGINLMNTPPAANARATADYVTVQTATVTDIDIEGGNHQSNDTKKYPPTFDTAKSFLPFPVSIIINSGYGLHGLCIYSAPITITADNRKFAEERNKNFIEVIRSRAGIYSKAVDSVGDLPRVLRVPGTRNYRLGISADAPICHIVEVNDVRFTPEQFDEKLNALYVEKKPEPKPTHSVGFDFSDDNPDLKEFRIRRMLDYISVVDGEYEKWLGVGIALFNEDMDCSLWENWSRTQPDFKEGECEHKWNGFHHDPNGISIASLYKWAVEGGYDAQETFREWKTLQNAARGVKLGASRNQVSHGRHSQPRKEFLRMNNDNKGSPDFQVPTDHQPGTNSPPNEVPTPDKADKTDYMKTSVVAQIIGVTKQAVEKWRKKGWFNADMIDHKGVYYYKVERVLQLKEVYRPDWETAWTGENYPTTKIDSLKTELRSVKKALADFNSEKKAAIEHLKNVDTFDSDSVFAEDVLTAAAFAKLFDKPTFSVFRRDVKNYGDKHKDKKVSVNDWLADVKERAVEIAARQADLIAKRNEIQAQINSLSFVGKHDALKDFTIPQGYSISETSGIIKVEGEKSIPVCRRPVIITGKTYSVEEKIYKLSLSFMTRDGKWKELSPTEKAIVFNKNKLVDLANADLPVTTSNATHLVDFLDAFNALNESSLSLTYTVSRCGWHNLNGKELFIDPRRDCVIQDDDQNISVKVDSEHSDFAKHMKQVGSLEAWKKIYKLAKKYPVARLTVSAAVAPILLKILGERNFLLYIYAPTRAGKTTALYLGASAVGSEKIIRSFDATKNGLAGAAADVNDYPFLVDEKQVADNRISEQMSNLIYALANGIGRTKLNRDSTLKKLQDWRTVAIMTGETLLLPDNVTGGANTRLLTIKAPKEILPADVCKIIRDTTPDNYGLALPLVIDKVFEFGREKLRGVYKNLVDVFTAKYPALLPEYCRYMAVLTLADALLNSVLFGNTVTNEDGKTFTALEDATLCAKEIFKLIPTRAEIDDTPREKEFVRSFIAQNQNRFEGGNVELNKMQAVYGKLRDRDGFTYITVQALKDACAGGGFDYRKLVSDLIADEFFKPADTTKKGRKTPLDTVQKRLGEVNTRCYRIPNTVFDETE